MTKKLESYPRFKAVSLETLGEEISRYLSLIKAPEFEGFLIAEDGLLQEKLNDSQIWGWRRRKVPRSLFFEFKDFAERFDELRNNGSDWMHVKIHGLLENRMLLSIQSPELDRGCLPENVPIQLTKREWKPKWTLE